MKSAIFQDFASDQRTQRKQQPLKRQRTQSPFPAGTPTLKSFPSDPKRSAAGNALWNLEDLISTCLQSSALPAPLSPTLPPSFISKQPLEDDEHEDDDIDSNDSDIDNLPMSLLSPTLPGNYGDLTDSVLLPPLTKSALSSKATLPKKATSASSTPKTTSLKQFGSKTVRSTSLPPVPAPAVKHTSIRWVNKLSDTERPRFLLRISFQSLLPDYKAKFRKTERTGLGIEEVKERDVKPGKDREKNDRKDLKRTREPSSDVSRNPWIKTVNDLKSQFDHFSSKDQFFSIILQFDWIICWCTSTDIDTGSHPSDSLSTQPWLDINTEIPIFVTRIEKFIKNNQVSDKKRVFLSYLVGILAVFKALVLKRVNVLLQSQIRRSNRDSEVLALQKQLILNFSKIETYLAESQSFFLNGPPAASIFPKAWQLRSSSIPKTSDAPASPHADKYFLPLGLYSDLKEACSYLYYCVREFSELYAQDINGGVRYTLQAGIKRK